MKTIINFNAISQKVNVEQLHINFTTKSVKGVFVAVKFIDRITKQHILYLNSFEISGYGETDEKAWQMLQFSLEDFFVHLFTLPALEASGSLISLGWEKSYLFNKEFSRAYADPIGNIQNFNAENDTLERVTLTAA